MSTDADTAVDIDIWNRIKLAQWERVANTQEGLQLVRYGNRRSIFWIVKSVPGFYEAVVLGQLPIRQKVVNQVGSRAHRREALEHEKPLGCRSIDLVDDQVQKVLDCWASGKSALTLPFVPFVYDERGQLIT